jgi:hypothetical protein
MQIQFGCYRVTDRFDARSLGVEQCQGGGAAGGHVGNRVVLVVDKDAPRLWRAIASVSGPFAGAPILLEFFLLSVVRAGTCCGILFMAGILLATGQWSLTSQS